MNWDFKSDLGRKRSNVARYLALKALKYKVARKRLSTWKEVSIMRKTLYDGEHFQVVLESKKPLVKGVKTDLHKLAGVMLAAGAAWLLTKKH